MAILQEKRVKFNSNMMVSNAGGNLSTDTDAGMILIKEFMDSIGFSELANQLFHMKEERLY